MNVIKGNLPILGPNDLPLQTRNGKIVTSDGRPVLLDQDGNPILGIDGKPVVLSPNGGRLIFGPDEEYHTISKVTPINNTQNTFFFWQVKTQPARN